jgi:hypothetical protein
MRGEFLEDGPDVVPDHASNDYPKRG